MMNTFQYENETSNLKTDVSWELDETTFFISTVTFKDGKPYNQMAIRCGLDNGKEHMESVIGSLLNNGFVPVEQV
jgi:hypothetical protein